MKYKGSLLISLILMLIFCSYPKDGFGQITRDRGDRINNPLGFEPVNLHLGVGALYFGVLTGAAYIIDRKNKEVDDKRLSFYLESGTNWSYRFPFPLIPETSLGVNYKVLKWLSYGADVGIYNVRDEVNQSTGLSLLRIFNRIYIRDTDKFRLWFESGVGAVYFTNIFPRATDRDMRRGTHWNGVVKYGLSAEYNINPSLAVFLGVRHLHFSNAGIQGRDRNPSNDSHGIFLGVNYNPRRDAHRKEGIE